MPASPCGGLGPKQGQQSAVSPYHSSSRQETNTEHIPAEVKLHLSLCVCVRVHHTAPVCVCVRVSQPPCVCVRVYHMAPMCMCEHYIAHFYCCLNVHCCHSHSSLVWSGPVWSGLVWSGVVCHHLKSSALLTKGLQAEGEGVWHVGRGRGGVRGQFSHSSAQ